MNKQHKKIAYIGLAFLVVLSFLYLSVVQSLIITYFNSSTTAGNISFSGMQNQTFYINISKLASVTYASINLSGLQLFGEHYTTNPNTGRVHGVTRNTTVIFVVTGAASASNVNITLWNSSNPQQLLSSFNVSVAYADGTSPSGGLFYDEAEPDILIIGGMSSEVGGINSVQTVNLTTNSIQSAIGLSGNGHTIGLGKINKTTYVLACYTYSGRRHLYKINSTTSQINWTQCDNNFDNIAVINSTINTDSCTAGESPDLGLIQIQNKIYLNTLSSSKFYARLDIDNPVCNVTNQTLNVYGTFLNFIQTDNITLSSPTLNVLPFPQYYYSNTSLLYGRGAGLTTYEIWNYSYPQDVYLEVGTPDGTREFSSPTEFNSSNNKTANFASTINTYLSSCSTDSTNHCQIPLLFHSNRTGVIQFTDINISYTTSPNVTLTSPANNTAASQNRTFTCNVSDDTYLKNITFWLWNSTSIVNQTSTNISGFSNGTNFIINFTTSATYFWNCLAYNNESNSSFSTTNLTIIVDLVNPAITQNFPTNNRYLPYKNNIGFNCTVDGTNLDTVLLYGNFSDTFALNKTITGITTGSVNTFMLNLTDRNYSWSCYANKTIASTVTPSQSGNFTLTVDSTFPTINISLVTLTTGSQTFTFNHSENDTYLSTCFFSIFNTTGGIDGLNNNVSMSCNGQKSATTSAFGTYSLYSYAQDLAGNINSTNVTMATANTVSAGGGGGALNDNRVSVIGLIPIVSTKNYSDLDREIIFAAINNLCSQKAGKGDIAIIDYSDSCRLTNSDVTIISAKLSSFSIIAQQGDIIQFIDGYYNKRDFQGSETEATIKQYSLFKSVVGTLSSLQINPTSVDSYFIINTNGGIGNVSVNLVANKPIKSCQVLIGGDNVQCLVANSTIKVTYLLQNTTFFNEIVTASVTLLTDAPQDKLESKTIPLTFRVYNAGYKFAGFPAYLVFIVGGIALIFGGIFVYSRVYKGKRSVSLQKLLSSS